MKNDLLLQRLCEQYSEQRRKEAETMCAKRRPTEAEIDRAMVIGKWFFGWNDSTGPCPISLSNDHWHKKLCALFEWIAVLEATQRKPRKKKQPTTPANGEKG